MNHRTYKLPILPKKFEAWHKIVLGLLAAASILSLAWGNLAEPRVEKMICGYTNPKFTEINDALEYNNCLHMVMMSDSQLARAEQLYKQCKRSTGVQLTGIKK